MSLARNVTVIPARRRTRNVDTEEKEKLKVAAYCRVSTDSEEQATSYEVQVEHYTTYIQNNPEWELAGIYADDGISGTNTKKREQFNKMIEDSMNGKIDMIITKSISRFARNTLDCLKFIRQLKDKEIPVFFEKENINTLIEAINWCIENEIEIINLSFGFRSENKQLKKTINSALQKGIIIVASIGNTYGMRGDYPAIYEGVYSVASINKDLQRSSFSAKRNIDFVMPGENIISTDQEGKYSTFSGTSFSTAYATGLISILYLEYNNETAQIKKNLSFDDYLKRHVFYGEEWTFDEYGYGLLNLRGEELQ